jgi:hypothetical protein
VQWGTDGSTPPFGMGIARSKPLEGALMRGRFAHAAAAALVLSLIAASGLSHQDQPEPKGDQDPKKPPPSQRGDNPQVFQPLTEEQERQLREERERYTIQPVKTEPDPKSLEEVAKECRMPGGGYFDRGEDRRVIRAVVPGMIGINQGLIEVFATLGPKDHESVMRIVCDIHVLDLTLSSFMGVKRGQLPQKYGAADESDESRLLAFVSWKGGDGKVVTHRAEDLLIDVKRGRLFPRVGWAYIGGWEETVHPISQKRQKMLRAALSKLLITSFRDPYSLIDNALKDEDATDDIYAANMFLLPPPGTEVMVAFRRPSAKELEEIKRVESEFYK